MAKEYALYKGDQFIDIGTAKQLAAKLNVSEETIKFYSRPIQIQRTNGNGYVAVRLEDDNEGVNMARIDETLMTISDLAEFFKLSNTHVKRYVITQPDFPKPIRLMVNGHPRWKYSEILEFIDQKKDI